jgi:flagellin
MANIGATTAFYKVETSLTRANNEVSKSMERLATGKQNANAGDRSSYVAMADTFRLDYVGTKAGIKGASVAMGYLETGMRVLDSASALVSRLQELAVLGANNTNTVADNEAINLEAEAIADEFHRLMTTSTYKGKNVFTAAASDQEIAMGGRGSEMSFGIGEISYSDLYSSTARTVAIDPNDGESFNLAHLPSDAIVAKGYGSAVTENNAESADVVLAAGKKYVVRGVDSTDEIDMTDTTNELSAVAVKTAADASQLTIKDSAGDAVTSTLASGQVIDVTTASTIDRALASAGVITFTSADTTGSIADRGGVGKDEDEISLTSGITDATRTAQTYTNVSWTATLSNGTTASAGTGATFDVTIDTEGVATVSITNYGSGFADGDIITFAAADVGAGASDLVITVDDITTIADRDPNTSFTITASDYTTSASGSGATFTVTTTSTGAATVTMTHGGTGFAVGETITIDGSKLTTDGDPAADLVLTVTTAVGDTATGTSVTFAEVKTDENAFKSTETYVIQSLGTVNTSGTISRTDSDAGIIAKAFTDVNGNQLTGSLSVGQKIKFASVGDTIGTTTVTQQHLDAANALIEGMTFTMSSDTLTADIEAVQALINRARVEAGSQYAALESAVSYTTDLTAQYELGFNTVNDVNFSAETAHLAKNQILQQAATAMLAQANSGQQGLLQLIQG